jgi:uncharacterized membrane protein YhhN
MGLEELVQIGLPSMAEIFGHWNAPSNIVQIVTLFSVASALILVKFTNGIKILTLPISYSMLFFGAMAFNRLAANLPTPGLLEMQRTILFTVAGHIVASFALLLFLRAERTSV